MSLWYTLKKIGLALTQGFFACRRTPDVRLIMTLLVKNEADMLEAHLRFHKAMGVDAFIVTDNNSTDDTPHIIEKYVQKGWIVAAIEERGDNYAQKRWVDRMVWLAKRKYGATWVINADADELWYAPSGCLKTEMQQTTANVLECDMRCVYPEEGKSFETWKHTVSVVPHEALSRFDLSIYSLFARQNKKVMHRTAGYIQISMGNHKVTMLPRRKANSEVRIYHYNIRGREHFMQKMINGGEQLERNPSKHGGRHWRYFYDCHKAGRLADEYRRVIGQDHFADLQQAGYIHVDTTIADYFDRHLS